MVDPGAPYNIPITVMGPAARRTVARMGQGRIAAVFHRSFYIQCGASFACIGVPELALGPLTASADVPNRMNWMSCGLRVGAPVAGTDGVVMVGNQFRFDARSARQWSPPVISDPIPIAVPTASVISVARASAPKHGLAPLIFSGGNTAMVSSVVDAALPAHRRLEDWVRLVTKGVDVSLPLDGVCRLLGLGPGLTPSGDDYLGGMMIALRAFGYGRAAERLYAIIDREASRRTNPISAAHLAAAREGWGAAPLHDVLDRLAGKTDTPLSSLIPAVDRIGHTSGWDGLTGLMAVVQALSVASNGGSRAA